VAGGRREKSAGKAHDHDRGNLRPRPRRRERIRQAGAGAGGLAFALPLLVEAALLLTFGFLGARLQLVHSIFVPATVSLICSMMGLQNAVITKISPSEIRTTHVTVIVTDIGIELGKCVYVNRHEITGPPPVLADRSRLRLLTMLLSAFFSGGVIGALGFRATIPLAVVLLGLAIVPAVDDVRSALRDERDG